MVFIRREDKSEAGFNVGIVLNRKPTRGVVGIEIEAEGRKLPKPPGAQGTHHPVALPGSNFWSYVHDGSLRGDDNAEYVLTRPIEFSAVKEALDDLWTLFKAEGSRIDDSNRTSCHIHLNCQTFHFNRLTSFLALYFTFEEILAEWCGDHRVGNLFCLRAKDAPAIVTHIKKFLRSDGKYELRENHHYAAMNAHALHKYGSVEIRTLRGPTDPQVVIDWVSILERLYNLSAEFPDPREICGMFSAEGPMSFFYNVLGDRTALVLRDISFTEEMIRDSLYEGIRMAQDLCYCRDWDLFKAINLKADPFGRDPRKLAAKMGGTTAPTPVPEWVSLALEAEQQWTTEQIEEAPQHAPQPFVHLDGLHPGNWQ